MRGAHGEKKSGLCASVSGAFTGDVRAFYAVPVLIMAV